jgi:hypothetical protein
MVASLTRTTPASEVVASWMHWQIHRDDVTTDYCTREKILAPSIMKLCGRGTMCGATSISHVHISLHSLVVYVLRLRGLHLQHDPYCNIHVVTSD